MPGRLPDGPADRGVAEWPASLSTASVSAPSAGTAEPSGGVITSSKRNGVAVTVNSPAGSATVRNTPRVRRCSSSSSEAMV